MNKILRKLTSTVDSKKIVRNNFLINCLILTIISVLVASGSSRYLFKYNLPEDNFVTLEISAYLEMDCSELMYEEEIDFEYMILCEEERIEVFTTRASGAVISTTQGRSYILTADHFCDIKSNIPGVPEEIFSVLEVEKSIKKDGKNYTFEFEKSRPEKDLCLITSDEYLVDESLKISKEMPEIGELTSTISSPLGISENGISLHFSGAFSGCNYYSCFFTIPAISGSSGSLVLNYDKEVVGMTQRSLVGFPEVTIGVGSYDISEFILEYESETGLDITPETFFEKFFF